MATVLRSHANFAIIGKSKRVRIVTDYRNNGTQRQTFLSKDGSRQWLVDAIDKARRKLSFHLSPINMATVRRGVPWLRYSVAMRTLQQHQS